MKKSELQQIIREEIENVLGDQSKKCTHQERVAVQAFVFSIEDYMNLPESEINKIINEYLTEWYHVKKNYHSIQDYLDEVDRNADYIQPD